MKKPQIIRVLTVICLIWAYSFVSCRKDQKPVAVDIYVAGTYKLDDGVTTSVCYWKNGEFHPIDDLSAGANIYDMKVINGSVYMAGQFNDKPCYWKDGIKIDLSMVNFNYLPGTHVRTLGLMGGLLTFGVNEITNSHPIFPIIRQPENGGVNYKVLDGNSTGNYITGGTYYENNAIYLYGSHKSGLTGYWVLNKVPDAMDYTIDWHPIGNNAGSIQGLKRLQNDIFTFGIIYQNNTSSYVYWKNDILGPLSINSSVASLNDMEINNGKPYFVGSDETNQRASIWVNNTKTELSSLNSSASDLFFYDGSSYIAGEENNSACYWLNNKLVSLSKPNSNARFIVVVPK
jgi:hypothetical protein